MIELGRGFKRGDLYRVTEKPKHGLTYTNTLVEIVEGGFFGLTHIRLMVVDSGDGTVPIGHTAYLTGSDVATKELPDLDRVERLLPPNLIEPFKQWRASQ